MSNIQYADELPEPSSVSGVKEIVPGLSPDAIVAVTHSNTGDNTGEHMNTGDPMIVNFGGAADPAPFPEQFGFAAGKGLFSWLRGETVAEDLVREPWFA